MAKDKRKPRLTQAAERRAEERRRRSARALRANLAKRRDQTRARAGREPPTDDGTGKPPADA